MLLYVIEDPAQRIYVHTIHKSCYKEAWTM